MIKMVVLNEGKVLSVRKLMDIAYCNRPRRKHILLATNDEFLQIIDGDKI